MKTASRLCLYLLASMLFHGCGEPDPDNSPAPFAGTWSFDATADREELFQWQVGKLRKRLGGEEHPGWREEYDEMKRARDLDTEYRMFRLELKADHTWTMENGGGYGGKVRGTIPTRASGRWSIADGKILLAVEEYEGQGKRYSATIKAEVVDRELHITYATGRKSFASNQHVGLIRLKRP